MFAVTSMLSLYADVPVDVENWRTGAELLSLSGENVSSDWEWEEREEESNREERKGAGAGEYSSMLKSEELSNLA